MQESIVVVVVIAVLSLVASQANRRAVTSDDGDLIGRYPTAVKIIANVGLVFALTLAIAAIYSDTDAILLAAVVSSSLLLMSAALWLEAYLCVIVVTPSGSIECRSPWRKARSIPLGDAYHVDFSQSMQWHRIFTRNHGIVRIHNFIQGHQMIIERVKHAIQAQGGSL